MAAKMLDRVRQVLARFRGDRRGVSAVEFALLAPLMITLYVGCVEVSDGVNADRKVSLIAAALANLSAQVTTISSTEMTNILDASSAIVSPYSTTQLTVTLSCIKIDANRNATVKWSVTRGGTLRSGSIMIPSALAVANSQLLFGEATYRYDPPLGYSVTGTINLSDRMYMSPRITAPTYNNTACT
jgi:Flp pilus assembly pilin Flp